MAIMAGVYSLRENHTVTINAFDAADAKSNPTSIQNAGTRLAATKLAPAPMAQALPTCLRLNSPPVLPLVLTTPLHIPPIKLPPSNPCAPALNALNGIFRF